MNYQTVKLGSNKSFGIVFFYSFYNNWIMDKMKQNPNLKKDYTKEFELA